MPKSLIKFQARDSKGFSIKADADGIRAEIIVYGQIGTSMWDDSGMSAQKFSDELKALPSTVKNLDVRINSPGGDVFQGITIYNRLKQHPAKITVYIDGLAASIASIIALAGDEVIIGDGALFMVHKPWTWTMGNSDELDTTVERLIQIEDEMVTIYKAKSGLPRDEIKSLLRAETWMSADEAIEKGFVDKKAGEALPIAASAFDKKWINKAPKKFKSEASEAIKAATELKNKIEARLKNKI